MHVLEWNDTDNAFEVDGDGVDDRLHDELSKSIDDEDAWGDSWVNPFIFLCEIKKAVLVNDYLPKTTPT